MIETLIHYQSKARKVQAQNGPTARLGGEESYQHICTARPHYGLVLVDAALVGRRVLGAELLKRVGEDRVGLGTGEPGRSVSGGHTRTEHSSCQRRLAITSPRRGSRYNLQLQLTTTAAGPCVCRTASTADMRPAWLVSAHTQAVPTDFRS